MRHTCNFVIFLVDTDDIRTQKQDEIISTLEERIRTIESQIHMFPQRLLPDEATQSAIKTGSTVVQTVTEEVATSVDEGITMQGVTQSDFQDIVSFSSLA